MAGQAGRQAGRQAPERWRGGRPRPCEAMRACGGGAVIGAENDYRAGLLPGWAGTHLGLQLVLLRLLRQLAVQLELLASQAVLQLLDTPLLQRQCMR
jgi:hypothetical protein